MPGLDSSKGIIELPLVSVILNCRNGEKYLREALDSVFNQSYRNWEIIFVNRGKMGSGKYIFFVWPTAQLFGL